MDLEDIKHLIGTWWPIDSHANAVLNEQYLEVQWKLFYVISVIIL